MKDKSAHHLYLCDPKKNKKCEKTSCWIYGGPCHRTSRKSCRLMGDVGETDEVIIRRLKENSKLI